MNTIRKLGSPLKRDRSVSLSSATSSIANDSLDGVSPELVPIVTLLLLQAHRRYHEGIFMLYYDLNGDGKPADRQWKEVYGILTGNQLAYWDAASLAAFRHNPEALLETSAKPNYLNFTDSVYNAMRTLPAAKQNLDNVIIVLTTLKNRYIIQFKLHGDLVGWYMALRLAGYEYQLLQEAYTGALLLARGLRLLDIRTVLAEKRFDHEDWVSIRYGSGMAWKRCYAVVEPLVLKRKSFTPGKILFYETDQKKKKQLMAVVSMALSVTAIYPQLAQLIDHSTMLKLEGAINFKLPLSKGKDHDDFKNTSLFLMPEQHSAVPGFDTLIRFLMPLLDSFGLYGRPKRLKADRLDPESLLFGLPTLPHVHYLDVSDLALLGERGDFFLWDVKQWTAQLKGIMKGKLDRGYEGCGLARGFGGALSSLSSPTGAGPNLPRVGSGRGPASPKLGQTHPNLAAGPNKGGVAYPNTGQKPPNAVPGSNLAPRPPNANIVVTPPLAQAASKGPAASKNVNGLSIAGDAANRDAHKSVQLADIYQKYSTIKSPLDQFHNNRNQLLNGLAEDISESELPSGIRRINLLEGPAYPHNDDDLFSEEESDSGHNSDDARQVGLLGGLVPPYAGNRNSSYSLVQLPMTQYKEFNEQFSKAVDKNQNPYPDSDSDEGPSPPPHRSNVTRSLPALNLAETVNDRLALHLDSGRVSGAGPGPGSIQRVGSPVKQPYLAAKIALPGQNGAPAQNLQPNSAYQNAYQQQPQNAYQPLQNAPPPNQSQHAYRQQLQPRPQQQQQQQQFQGRPQPQNPQSRHTPNPISHLIPQQQQQQQQQRPPQGQQRPPQLGYPPQQGYPQGQYPPQQRHHAAPPNAGPQGQERLYPPGQQPQNYPQGQPSQQNYPQGQSSQPNHPQYGQKPPANHQKPPYQQQYGQPQQQQQARPAFQHTESAASLRSYGSQGPQQQQQQQYEYQPQGAPQNRPRQQGQGQGLPPNPYARKY